MPWVRFTEVDGFKIVTGFDAPSIDPIATARVIDPLLVETDEHRYFEKLRTEFGDLERRRQGLLTASRRARNHGELESTKRIYEDVVEQQRIVQSKAIEHKSKYTAKRIELFKSHAVRFEVPGYQEIDQETKDRLTDALALLRPDQLLTIEGHVLTDLRGGEYWFKDDEDIWLTMTNTELGEELPPGAKLREELTADEYAEIRHQGNLTRISALSDGEKRTEREQKIKDALAIAAKYRSQYEIEGRADPLGDSKQWFCEEKSRIEKLYQ